MQTHDLYLTATIGRPTTLSHDCHMTSAGLYFGRITYLITDVPVDVPAFEVVNLAKRHLSCRTSHLSIYEFAWPSLTLADRR